VTPAADISQPDSNPALYVSSVLTLYVDLPDTSCAPLLRINGSPAASMMTACLCVLRRLLCSSGPYAA